jgi:Tfp pilus assembly protein PilF
MRRYRGRYTAWLTVALVLVSCSRDPRVKEARYLSNGKQLMDKKDYARAILQFKNAAQTVPGDAEAMYQLGRAYLALKDFAPAAQSMRKAAQLNPHHAGAQIVLAEMMDQTDNPDLLREAERKASDVLAESPWNLEALDALALAELRLGKREDAERRLIEALAAAPQRLQSSLLLARLKMARKDMAGTEEVLKAAVGQAPESVDAAIAMGRFYVLTGRRAEAENEFRRALRIDPKNGAAMLDLGRLQLQNGNTAGGEKTLQQLSALADPAYHSLYGLFLLRQGKKDASIAEFQRLNRADADDRQARTGLISAYLSADRPRAAESVLNSALSKNPKDTDALLGRAQLNLRTRNYAKSEQDLNTVLHFHPNSGEARYLLAQCFRHQGDTKRYQTELTEALRLSPLSLAWRMELSEAWSAPGSYALAAQIMDEAPAQQRHAVAAITRRNWAYLGQGDLATARVGVDEGLQLARNPELLLQDGLIRLEERDWKGARNSFRESLAANLEDTRPLNSLVLTYVLQSDEAEALRTIRQYAASQPKSAAVQFCLGDWLVRLKKPAEARTVFEKVKVLNARYVEADIRLAEIDITEDHPRAALDRLQPVLASDPENVGAQMAAGLAEEQTGNHGAAVEHFRMAARFDPRNLTALEHLALDLAGTDPNEALQYAEAAKAIAPTDTSVDDVWGQALYESGNYLAAAQVFKTIPKGKATAAQTYRLAMAYLRAGNLEAGRGALREAMKMDSQIPERSLALRILAETTGKAR